MMNDRPARTEASDDFRIISELISDFVYAARVEADRSVVIEWVTDPVMRVTGYSHDEINARSWESIIHPEDLPHFAHHLAQLLEGQNSISEHRIVARTGEVRWIRNYARPVLDEQNHLVRIYGAVQDITERKQVEAELRRSEERFKLAASGMALTLFEQDRDLRYVWVYPNRPEFPEGNIGKTDADLIPEEEARVLTRLKQQVIETGAGARQEIQATLPGEARWYDLVIEPKRDSHGAIIGVAGVAFDITERKRADAQLRESEERFAKAFNANPDPMTIHRISDGRYVAANDSFLRITGFTREEIIGRTASDLNLLVDDEDRARWREALREIGHIHNLEALYRTRGGEIRTALLSAEIIDVGGEPCILAVSADITDRKRAEEALKKSQQQLQLTLEAARVGICEWSLSDNSVIWSKEHFEILGYEPFSFEPFYIHWRDRAHPDDVIEVEAEIEAARVERRLSQKEYRIVLPSGDVRWVLARGRFNYDESGQADSLSGLLVDITGRKRAEETVRSLLRISDRLNSTLDLSALLDILAQEAISLVNAESGVAGLYTEKGMVAQKYFKSGEAVPFEYCWPPGHGLPGWLILTRAPHLTNDASSDSRIDQELRQQFGVRSALSTPVLDARGEPLGFFEIHNKRHSSGFTESDQEQLLAVSQAAAIAIQNALAYSEIQRAGEERAQLLMREQALRIEAEQANRLKDEFLATISHELRTPLNAILGWSNMLRGGKLDAEIMTRAFEIIERNARSQARIIEDLLDISRIITGKLRLNIQSVELPPVIEAALDVIRPAAAAKNIHLEVALDSHAGPVSGDPERLQQVIWNLLSNAVKFTEKGGRVQARLRRLDSHVALTVSDTGRGISPDFLPFVFDRFRQADSGYTRAHGGLGLGLAIVRQLVEMHGGSVSAYSPGEGQGSTFTVNLPLMISHAPAPASAMTLSQGEQADSSDIIFDCPPVLINLRLLIVEDDLDARFLLRTLLEECEAEVRTAGSVAETFEVIEEWEPDLLISDIEMPGEDGYSLIHKIRLSDKSELRRLPAIALTAHARGKDRVRALTAGFDAHVAKPVEASELITVIQRLARISGKR